jgi:hypothetical protein
VRSFKGESVGRYPDLGDALRTCSDEMCIVAVGHHAQELLRDEFAHQRVEERRELIRLALDICKLRRKNLWAEGQMKQIAESYPEPAAPEPAGKSRRPRALSWQAQYFARTHLEILGNEQQIERLSAEAAELGGNSEQPRPF